MSSSSFSCVKTEDMAALSRWVDAYKQMGNIKVVVGAATEAGEYLREQMQKLIQGESSLAAYSDVADALRVWDETRNVFVGIPPEDPVLPRALEMDKIYPVNEVAFDLAKESGDVEQRFHDALVSAVTA